MNILVTGGNGFIGSNLIKYVIKNTNHRVWNIDKLTYAANPLSLKDLKKNDRYNFINNDICQRVGLSEIFNIFHPDMVIHMAAESHVDRSINAPEAFLQTNVMGTYTVLEVATHYWRKESLQNEFKFIHVSTDEVYGSLGAFGKFTEQDQIKPNSPYSASKASSDCLVNAWHRTYGLPTIVTHCSNNFGPYQQTEKFLPTVITKTIQGQPVPIYGDGFNVRDWIYVDDHVKALLLLIDKGMAGETYNIGANQEWTNHALKNRVFEILKQNHGLTGEIQYVDDRAGHDYRYAVDASKIKDLGWQASDDFDLKLTETIDWYINNKTWWNYEASN